MLALESPKPLETKHNSFDVGGLALQRPEPTKTPEGYSNDVDVGGLAQDGPGDPNKAGLDITVLNTTMHYDVYCAIYKTIYHAIY